MEPLIKECLPEQTLQLAAKTSLFGNLKSGSGRRPASYPEDGKSWGKPLGYLLMRQTWKWMRKKKDCASLMRVIGYRFTKWMITKATQYQTEIARSF